MTFEEWWDSDGRAVVRSSTGDSDGYDKKLCAALGWNTSAARYASLVEACKRFESRGSMKDSSDWDAVWVEVHDILVIKEALKAVTDE